MSNLRVLSVALTTVLGLTFLGVSGLSAKQLDYEPGVLIIQSKIRKGLSLQGTSGPSADDLSKELGVKLKSISFPGAQKLGLLSSGSAASNKQLSVVEFKDSEVEALAKRFESLNSVDYAEPNYYVYSHGSASTQKYLFDTSLKSILTLPIKKEVLVAVIDTGLNIEQPGIRNAVYMNSRETVNGIDDDGNGYIDDVNGYNFLNVTKQHAGDGVAIADVKGHGTHISGIIAASETSGTPVQGINPKAKLLTVRFMDGGGRGTQLDAAYAIRYAADMGADIINCSWGYFRYNRVLKDAIDYAHQKGCIILAAVGNSNSHLKEYPAAFSNVIAVGAINDSGSKARYSSYGSHLDLVTYGDNIRSLGRTTGTSAMSGTSQATAVVSGIAARVKAYNPSITANEMRSLLLSSTKDVQDSGKDIWTGHGAIDGDKLITKLGWAAPKTSTTTASSSHGSPPSSSPSSSGSVNGVLEFISEYPILAPIGVVAALVLIL